MQEKVGSGRDDRRRLCDSDRAGTPGPPGREPDNDSHKDPT